MSFRQRMLAAQAKTDIKTVNLLSPKETRLLLDKVRTKELYQGVVTNQDGVSYLSDARKVLAGPFSSKSIETKIINTIEELYLCSVIPSDPLQILSYEAGGYYHSHSDGHTVFEDQNGIKAVEVHPRDYSIVLYLNDDFEGGEFEFVHSGEIIKPSPGKLIIFPSDWRHEHRVHTITSGVRWAIVGWFTSNPRRLAKSEVIGVPSAIRYYRNYLKSIQK